MLTIFYCFVVDVLFSITIAIMWNTRQRWRRSIRFRDVSTWCSHGDASGGFSALRQRSRIETSVGP